MLYYGHHTAAQAGAEPENQNKVKKAFNNPTSPRGGVKTSAHNFKKLYLINQTSDWPQTTL